MAKPRSTAQLKEYNRKRDFKKTAEPEGAVYAKKSKRLDFVVQKHEASHLHYDIRLEVDGVMKSWACPKGPSFDPSVKRLAVQVEDHPTSYNTFEGSIPAGEYGGGTVMVWDKGYYTVDDAKSGDDPEALMREGIDKGKLAFTFHGQKLRGSFTLVRTRMSPGSKKAQWLLIKHRDDEADPSYDPVSELARSAATKRTMEEIEAGSEKETSPSQISKTKSRSKREIIHKPADKDRQAEAIRESVKSRKIGKSNKSTVSTALKPMLVHKTEELLEGEEYTYEQKLDGVRLVAYCDGEKWTVVSRLGNDKSAQFPEIGPGLLKLAKKAKGSLILDGEIVAVDKKGLPLGFQDIQGRIHVDNPADIKRALGDVPTKFFVFDLLLLGDDSLLERPLRERRALLEKLFKATTYPSLQLNPADTSAKKMRARATKGEWEGLIIKDLDSPYLPGIRTKNWLKWKIVQREELIIAGWTVPRGSRQHIGSLLLGYHDEDGQLIFAGHVGSGFSAKSLKDLYQILKSRERKTCPFAKKPVTNGEAHWVKPELVAEVKFHEWTAEGNLRHGTFLGLRDDKRTEEIVHTVSELSPPPPVKSKTTPKKVASKKANPAETKAKNRSGKTFQKQMEEIKEEGGKKGEGFLRVDGSDLRVTHLDKIMFPKPKVTKQDLLQYYHDMADYVLPWMEGRPLVMRRFPQGITGKDFYQQAPEDDAPGRIVSLKGEDGELQNRLIGGDLISLLYLIQMGCISYDPWHSRVESLNYPDYTIIDLDPLAGTSFETVREIALACLDVIEAKGFSAGIKTSGATGLHIYLPLPPKTKWESGRLVAEILCAEVDERHSKATVERMVKRRPKGSVYLDSQQNYLSKSVAGVWSVRAKPGSTVSTPISRKELEAGALPGDFTLHNVPGEAKARSKLWTAAMSHPIDLGQLAP